MRILRPSLQSQSASQSLVVLWVLGGTVVKGFQ